MVSAVHRQAAEAAARAASEAGRQVVARSAEGAAAWLTVGRAVVSVAAGMAAVSVAEQTAGREVVGAGPGTATSVVGRWVAVAPVGRAAREAERTAGQPAPSIPSGEPDRGRIHTDCRSACHRLSVCRTGGRSRDSPRKAACIPMQAPATCPLRAARSSRSGEYGP